MSDASTSPQPERAVLLRVHQYPSVCRNRAHLLKLFNPALPIHVLYGGPAGGREAMERALEGWADSFTVLEGASPSWCWKNGDLAVRRWYDETGRSHAFDVLHIIEWDMLFLNPLSDIYEPVPPEAVGLSGIVPLAKIDKNWIWTTREPYRTEHEGLVAWVKSRHADAAPLLACIAGGACFPRAFLEAYAAAEVPEMGNDELRMPLFARLLGFPICDTGIYSWEEKGQEKLFRLGSLSVRSANILGELGRPGGRRVFHPYRMTFGAVAARDRLFDAKFFLFRECRVLLRHVFDSLGEWVSANRNGP